MSVPTAQVITSQAVVQGDVALRPVLPVTPGQTIAARVVTNADGRLELAIGNQRLVAMSDVPLEPGEALRLVVRAADEQRVTLQLMARGDGSGQAAAAQGGGAPPPAPLAATSSTSSALSSGSGAAGSLSPAPTIMRMNGPTAMRSPGLTAAGISAGMSSSFTWVWLRRFSGVIWMPLSLISSRRCRRRMRG